MIIRSCEYCKKELEFDNGWQFGAHKVNCDCYPNKAKKIEKARLAKIHLKTIYELVCSKCGVGYQKELTENNFINGDYPKCCSFKCSNSRKWSPEDKKKKQVSALKSKKVFKANKRRRGIKIDKKCSICNKNFKVLLWQINKKTCSSPECLKKQLSISCKGKTGGYRTKSGRSKIHGGYYKNIWMDSSWETVFAKRLDALNIKWSREDFKFPYVNEKNEMRNYYPDFYLPDRDLFIEIKGYWTSQIRHKIDAALKTSKFNLKILESLDEVNQFV